MNLYNNLSSIRTKMLIVFIPVLLIATISIATISILDAKSGLEEQIETRITTDLNRVDESIEHEFTAHRQIAESIASVYKAKQNEITKSDYRAIIEKLLSINSNTLGSGLWLENYAYDPDVEYFGPYIYKSGDEFVYTEEYEVADYDYPSTDWYIIGKSAKNGVGWTDPYYDETTGITMITTAVPIDIDNDIVGVVSADYDLTTIQSLISEVKLETTGFAFLLDSNGQFIAHKDDSKVMKQSINEDKDLNVIANTIMDNDTGSANVKLDEKDFKAYYLTLKSTGWKLVVMAPTAELFSSVNDMVLKAIIITFTIILLTTVFIIFYSTSFSNSIKRFVHNLGFLAQGDFTKAIEVKTKDEIGEMGDYYNSVLKELRNMINSISKSSVNIADMTEVLSGTSKQVAIASEEVSMTIEEIAKGASDQAKDTEVTAHNIEELGDLLEEDLNYIQELNNASAQIESHKEEGFLILENLIEKTEKANKATDEVSKIILGNNESAEKIEKASEMIQSISDQTNLLALNAAIEAARAGESGRGFAVVAEEIRKLAEQSNSFTMDIRGVIDELKANSQSAVTTMEDAKRIVEDQGESVKQTESKFEGIAEAIDSIKIIINGLNNSADLMMKNKNRIIDLTQSLSAISEENAAGTEQAAAAMEEQVATIEQVADAGESLATIAEELRCLVEKFKV